LRAIWIDPSIFSKQLTLPVTSGTVTFGGNTLTCNFGGVSTGIFTMEITADMTGVAFTGGRTGGQYVIYITTTGIAKTISPTFTPTTTYKTNIPSAITVTSNTVALLTVTTNNGSTYLIAGSAYN
jgi:hypothetical protein